ncbi:MAG: type II secretion system F family protein [Candidatus Gastranaerophilales bacterium]|nr:type II secretion system F family protein [Candidatus Gastranaerophilales bacterium]
MAVYIYSAFKENNKIIVTGRVEASDLTEARRKIKDMDLTPISLVDEETKEDKKAKSIGGAISSLSLREKIDFTSTLEILTSTGIPIIEALLFIEQNSNSKRVRSMTHEFRKQIIGGSTLGETLEKYRNIFGRVYIGLVKAGEDSGELDKTLVRMLELLNKQDNIKSKVVGALIYPSIVILLAVVAILVMLIFVFPAFDEMFNNLGKPLPWITRTCMDAGIFLKTYWALCIVAAVCIVVALKQVYQNPSVRRVIDNFVLSIPMLSDLLKFSNFSNFIAVLQVAYEAGIPIVDCLFLANLTIDNHVLKTSIMQVASKVQQGTHLSVALKGIPQVPTMMQFMIATGEQSGRLGDSLYHCVNFIDKKLDNVIEGFTKMIEPLLMLFIGVIVGVLGLALYMPLFQAYQQ